MKVITLGQFEKDLESAGFGSADMAARQKSYLQAEQDMYKASLPKRPGFQTPKP